MSKSKQNRNQEPLVSFFIPFFTSLLTTPTISTTIRRLSSSFFPSVFYFLFLSFIKNNYKLKELETT